MADSKIPALFLSHGSPLLALLDSPARRFLVGLGARLPRPKAIVVLSAHYDAADIEVTGAPAPRTIHDFGGVPRELYALRYAAPGDPALAAEIAARLTAAALPARVQSERGLDHGAWIPLLLMYPAADLPVVQVSIDSERPAEHHFALGRALQPLRDAGVLVVGSGGATHNLSLYMRSGERAEDSAPLEWVEAFNEWVAGAIETGRTDDLLHWQQRAPYAAPNHPTPEHFLPLFAALGAAGEGELGKRIHMSYDRGLLSLDSYAFGWAPAAAAAAGGGVIH